MITAYCSNCKSVEIRDLSPAASFPEDVVWIDMVEPSREEELYVEKVLGIEVPTRDDLKDIEPSARLYTENGAVFMAASLVWKADTDAPTLTDVAFILAGKRLITIRYAHPKSFALFIAALHRLPENWRSGAALLAKLLETIVDRTAEILETAVSRIDILSTHVFGRAKKVRRPSNYLEQKLRDIAGHHRMISKLRDSLGSLSRLLTFFHTIPAIQQDHEARELCRSVSRDIQSLSEHASFVAANITFLLDASLGLINIEQNSIIKIFSIASVVFLPPTLVASIYGMNFQVMPELAWAAGYPYSLALMVISAVIPFFFFRWKGWL
ncbi:magnesium transporter CorA family protein [Rhizobium bangladeshense]|uniref:Magnesium transporter CorA family protein n=1 Tax=Rhizobium bangladeshense TaxID=1138189 RepID=A0ABS7LDH7_9HYPH|nr:magnesium transporter CorA family protein [Rhizobium bangladeshense]MBX4865522.1 magnesium transporter CorA family protein [Rhizobium bangladeshense]MBX4875356.1 magnesium transporter CorA family protein [Rhizobium bangladeshense]MBX4882104.1 magnesium transporter CorA family protein [Rhizobium bangladeshense]MBX4892647.1 magnesium transporter CorA family protein [Rhizobium bangladeshense]MBX4913785.1 magnesium transporter CorA family protein [Rhizobium bangladeshense]